MFLVFFAFFASTKILEIALNIFFFLRKILLWVIDYNHDYLRIAIMLTLFIEIITPIVNIDCETKYFVINILP